MLLDSIRIVEISVMELSSSANGTEVTSDPQTWPDGSEYREGGSTVQYSTVQWKYGNNKSNCSVLTFEGSILPI